jgi:hypothetical protein
VLPPLFASLWGGSWGGINKGPFATVAVILAFDAILVLLSRRPSIARGAQTVLLLLLIASAGWTLLMSCIVPLISAEPGIGGQIFLQFGIFYGLVTAVQWFSMRAAGESA